MKAVKSTFAKKVMAEARRIGTDEDLFIAAEAALRKAIKGKDKKSEIFWRKVFAAYAEVVGNNFQTDKEAEYVVDLWHCATLYKDGGDPGDEEDPVKIKKRRARYVAAMRKRDPRVTESRPPDDDSDIPF